MLDLYLLRHAKSSWKDSHLDDYHRPLNSRGLISAKLMGCKLTELGISPQRVYCSSAKRCKSTLKIMDKAGFKSGSLSFSEELYHASSNEILSLIHSTSNEVSSLMIVGHNPGLHILLKSLIGTHKKGVSLELQHKFPTTAFAHLQCNFSCWSDIAPHTGKLYRYLTPKQLA